MSTRAPVPCIINNVNYANLKGALRSEKLEYTKIQRHQIRAALKLGKAVQVNDGPIICPDAEVVLL